MAVSRPLWVFATGVAGALALSSCSVIGGTEEESQSSDSDDVTVTLVSHDSFNMDQEVLDAFAEETGITIDVVLEGDGGELANKLVLTDGAPLGDVVFGINSDFASRVVEADVLQAYEPQEASDDLANYAIEGEGSDLLTPIDFGDVCVNIDHEWFADEDIDEPETLEDLTKPEYEDLFVVQNPATSSPGLSFLMGTIAEFGDDWPDYWQDLADNGVQVSQSWTDSYSVEFSGSSGEGPLPLVVSYASSPPYEVPEDSDEAPTGALLDTCARQVEYAGILQGTEHEDEAQQVVDFLISQEFQEAIAEEMFMYPVRSDVDLPEEWQKYAAVADDAFTLPAEEIEANREDWIKTWTDVVIG